MNRTNKNPETSRDKNLARIEKQSRTQRRVRNGLQLSGSGGREVPGGTSSDMDNKSQTGNPRHPMFAVDPELERQMAAQGVPQKILPKKKNAGKSGRSSTPGRRSQRKSGSEAKKKPARAGDKSSEAWDGKGEPTFASPDQHQPGPL
ncbi:hypothetical protein [Arachidicoccus terrestris]|uniref:hypothetical protein n=1 Tax=Arachidicoccus terrestris TaxID=2875539 RepID=UPI001CC44BC3|nr:hypothetical protein [Arachidicoccus terrestris]UAY55910.1 hypothetical protein K9M52_02435 [Arachidicoccus terrestris]